MKKGVIIGIVVVILIAAGLFFLELPSAPLPQPSINSTSFPDASGFGGLQLSITPALGTEINGTVTLEVLNVNPLTEIVAFGIQGGNITDVKETGPNIGVDINGEDGWKVDFDTTLLPNGEYDFFAIAGTSNPEELPLAAVNIKINIQN